MGNLESPAHLDLVSLGSLDWREREHDLRIKRVSEIYNVLNKSNL